MPGVGTAAAVIFMYVARSSHLIDQSDSPEKRRASYMPLSDEFTEDLSQKKLADHEAMLVLQRAIRPSIADRVVLTHFSEPLEIGAIDVIKSHELF